MDRRIDRRKHGLQTCEHSFENIEAKTLHAKLPHRSLRGSLHRSPKTPTLQTCEHSMTAAVMQVETNSIAPYRPHFQFGCDCQPYLQTTQTHVSNQSVLPNCFFCLGKRCHRSVINGFGAARLRRCHRRPRRAPAAAQHATRASATPAQWRRPARQVSVHNARCMQQCGVHLVGHMVAEVHGWIRSCRPAWCPQALTPDPRAQTKSRVPRQGTADRKALRLCQI